MRAVIEKIAAQEKFEIDDEALDIIISSSGGSMRDALSLLDQVVSGQPDKITGAIIRELLGVLPKEMMRDTVAKIAANDVGGLIDVVEQIAADGFDVLQFAKDLRNYLRQMMIFSINRKADDISQDDKDFFLANEKLFSLPRHVRINKLISNCIDRMNRNDAPQVLLEMYLMKMAEDYYDISTVIKRVVDIEKQLRTGSPVVEEAPQRVVPYQAQNTQNISAPTIPNTPSPSKASGISGLWQTIVKTLSAKSILASPLSEVVPQETESAVLLKTKNQLAYDTLEKFKPDIIKLFNQNLPEPKSIEISLTQDAPMPASVKPADIEKDEAVLIEEIPAGDGQDAVLVDEELSDVGLDIKDEDNAIPDKIKKIAESFEGTVEKVDKKK
jgi:DNA polymerase-3 subunit gamma/tau